MSPEDFRAAGARVQRAGVSRIQQSLHAKRMRSEFNEASTAFLATPSATNWERLHRAMMAHQEAVFGNQG